MTTIQPATPRPAKRSPAGARGAAPWQRALLLVLATTMVVSPVSARGPGRPGIADLVEEPDVLPARITRKTANLAASLDPTQRLPGNPSVPGSSVDASGEQPLTVSIDAIRGSPETMTMGQTVISDSGELMVPLQGVAATATVGGRPAIPAVNAHIGTVDLVPPLVSLKATPIPPVTGIEQFVRDRSAAIALGKALFWDAKVGSDGQACASCHFSAGADNRLKNQLNPGQRGSDNLFNRTFTGEGGPNYVLKPEDFPFLRLLNPLDRNSAITFQTNDVVSSQGTFAGDFMGLASGGTEKCGNRPVDEFSVHGILTRRVAPRNAPTVINAVFNYRNFWDGRANNTFNGNNPFGERDPDARVLQRQGQGQAAWVRIHLPNASLASQAVGPALSDFEMSCANKTFPYLGRKMIPLRALSGQKVHAEDSVLAPLRDSTGVGLTQTYEQMIKAAFLPEWWSAPGTYAGFSQMESNFSMLWGLAIMLYETTLVSDEAPIDRFVGWSGSPPDPNALSVQERRGLAIFRGGKATCVSCHRGAEFTSAGSGLQQTRGETNLVEQMFVGRGTLGLYDSGFYNIGVRPTAEDVGVGGTDPFGNSLSFSRQYLARLGGQPAPDRFLVDPCLFSVKSHAFSCWLPPSPALSRVGVDGAFKVPSLRNIALTQPYFHNGSRFTLEQVVEFYNRGGDRRGPDGNDTTGFGGATAPNGGGSNVHPAIRPLGLTPAEKNDLVAFLRNALTDRRVACERAPFDHPALRIPNGHSGTTTKLTAVRNDIKAVDEFIDLPEVGAKGVAPRPCMKDDLGTPFVEAKQADVKGDKKDDKEPKKEK
ncbi:MULTISPECIES: cytochrome-c peroxidase [Ramlibacter]|uniref:Cytochrome-c peroxidase n=1 Tax=Ramlibacter pinisoli TaxID=2682844 RepID=A0A6N8IXP2_9BURK|nr:MULTISPECIES: cytochrome c peroxidase [Ramlibacter]MBA2961839.1 cytochrome-c peroxidase [Ramlibacter sp. CGMCC 1.13660]MVQ31781.1 cytochrome-c peroxidase [Ramlibacter pinisoli]